MAGEGEIITEPEDQLRSATFDPCSSAFKTKSIQGTYKSTHRTIWENTFLNKFEGKVYKNKHKNVNSN